MTQPDFHPGTSLPRGILACASMALLSACSVLVNWAEKEEQDPSAQADAGGSLIDAALGPDATPTAFCGPSLSATLANFSFEADEGLLVLSNNVVGGPTGASWQVSGNQFNQNPLVIAAGPEGCGNAARIPEAGTSILEFQDGDLSDALSLDFWVRLDPIASPPAIQGIVSKDRQARHNGDFQVSAYRDSAANKSYFVLRIQREFLDGQPAGGTYYACSPEIALDQWHHIAVSATGQPVQMFVDGQLATHNVTIEPAYGAGAACDFDMGGFGANLTTFSENNNNWVFGASTGRSPGTVAESFLSGSIDELRFRSAGFTLSEAQSVYGSGRGLAP